MQFYFFATDEDLVTMWRLLYEIPSIRIFEHYSEPDQANRWMHDWEEFVVRYNDHKGFLAAWLPSVGGQPRARWIEFESSNQRKLGGKGRTILESPALIEVFGLGDQHGCLGNSSLKCLSEKGARQRSSFSEEFCDEVNWQQFRSLIAKIQRQLRKICPGKLRHVPIMPDAFKKFQTGQIKLWWGQEYQTLSEFVTPH